jgi:hypothetical protein
MIFREHQRSVDHLALMREGKAARSAPGPENFHVAIQITLVERRPSLHNNYYTIIILRCQAPAPSAIKQTGFE